MKRIYIYGASGHGLVVADIARACGYDEVVFVDDGDNEFQSFEEIISNTNIPIAFGVGANKIRKKLFEKVERSGFKLATLIHPSSIVSQSATIGKGSVVMPLVIVNAKAQIGNGVILNSGCVIEHECSIGDFVHISPSVALAGNVSIGELTHIGIGSSVIQGISIGSSSIVGAGSVVVKNIKNNKKAYGNPCCMIGDIIE
ncbi:MAG: acetyltransferase [Campylobacterales bacterium]|nr:acetyltransferase [Campylobacterales bacterium]